MPREFLSHVPSMSATDQLQSLGAKDAVSLGAEDADRTLDAETATVTKVVLSGVQLTVPRGRLLGVAGSVGSGKTSLVTGITGQVGERAAYGEDTTRGI